MNWKTPHGEVCFFCQQTTSVSSDMLTFCVGGNSEKEIECKMMDWS